MVGNIKPETDGHAFPRWRYFTYSAADLSYSLIYFWIVSFLTIYYTDVLKISMVTVSVMMLVTRIYDAVNDPLIGGILDNTRSKMGRYRPWVIIGGFAMAVSAAFLFWEHPDLSYTGKVVYAYVTYMMCTTAMTVFFMAYGALGCTISTDSMVRVKANSVRFSFQGIGNLAIGYFVPMLLTMFATASVSRGYMMGVIISGVIAIPFILITGFGTKEVIYPPEKVKIPFKVQFRALVTNKPMLIITTQFFLNGANLTLRMTAASYYFTYVAKDFKYFSLFNLLQSLLAILGSLTAMYLFKFIKDKAKALGLVLTVTVFLLIGMYIFPAPSIAFFIFAALSGYSNGATPAISYSMLPDAVDYTQYKDGLRIDGFLAAIASFAFKSGMAVSGALVGIVLTAIGYVANVEQTASTLTGISVMLAIIPAFLVAGMAVLMFIYPLNEKKHDEILAVLREKKLL